MVTFVKKKIKSQTLGEKLKKFRKESRITLGEISKSKKIRKEYLEKIENGDYNQLPPDVYIRGFLKGYAEYLGIQPKEILKQYDKEKKISTSLSKKEDTKEEKFKINIPHLTLTPKIISSFLLLFLATAGFIYFYRELTNFSKDPRLVIIQPESNISIDKSSYEVIGITDKDNRVNINGQPVYVNAKGEFKEKLSLQNGLNKIKIEAKNKFDNSNEKNINISADYKIEIAGTHEENNPEDQNSDKLILEIRVQDDPVWTIIKVDDKGVQSGTMLPNSTQTFEAEERILITSGKANKTFIKINDKDFGVLDESPGVIRDVIITKDNIVVPESDLNEESEKNKKED